MALQEVKTSLPEDEVEELLYMGKVLDGANKAEVLRAMIRYVLQTHYYDFVHWVDSGVVHTSERYKDVEAS